MRFFYFLALVAITILQCPSSNAMLDSKFMRDVRHLSSKNSSLQALSYDRIAASVEDGTILQYWKQLIDMYLDFSGVTDAEKSKFEFLPLTPSNIGSPILHKHNKAVFDIADRLPSVLGAGSYSSLYAMWLKSTVQAPQLDLDSQQQYEEALKRASAATKRFRKAEVESMEAYEIYLQRMLKVHGHKYRPLPFELYVVKGYEPEYNYAKKQLDYQMLRLSEMEAAALGSSNTVLRQALIDAQLATESVTESVAGLNMVVAKVDVAKVQSLHSNERNRRMPGRYYGGKPYSHPISVPDHRREKRSWPQRDENEEPPLEAYDKFGLDDDLVKRSRAFNRNSEEWSRKVQFIDQMSASDMEFYESISEIPEYQHLQSYGHESRSYERDAHDGQTSAERYAPSWEIEALSPVLNAWKRADSDEFVYNLKHQTKDEAENSKSEMSFDLRIPALAWILGAPSGELNAQHSQVWRETLETGVQVRISWKGMRLFKLRPGWWFGYNFETVRLIEEQLFDSNATNLDAFYRGFSSVGKLNRIASAVLVGVNPSIELQLSRDSYKKIESQLKASGGICLFGLCANMGKKNSPNANSQISINPKSLTIRIARTDDVPMPIARSFQSFN